ncbi:MAG: hypothetical protein PVI39_12555, partial [Desulfobacteraceae bacterium]
TVSKKVQDQGAQISRSEAYLCTPQRLRDAAQHRDWTFCGTVKIGAIIHPEKVRLQILAFASWGCIPPAGGDMSPCAVNAGMETISGRPV